MFLPGLIISLVIKIALIPFKIIRGLLPFGI